jgi:hypothetical protein
MPDSVASEITVSIVFPAIPYHQECQLLKLKKIIKVIALRNSVSNSLPVTLNFVVGWIDTFISEV